MKLAIATGAAFILLAQAWAAPLTPYDDALWLRRAHQNYFENYVSFSFDYADNACSIQEQSKGNGETSMYKASRLKAARHTARLSQEGAARQLKPPVASATISNWERGVTQPDAGYLEQLGDVYRCGYTFFFTGQRSVPQQDMRVGARHA